MRNKTLTAIVRGVTFSILIGAMLLILGFIVLGIQIVWRGVFGY